MNNPVATAVDVGIGVGDTQAMILSGVELELLPGEVVGIAGETGSGKTTLGLALLGHFGPGLEFRTGTVEVAGTVVAGPGQGSSEELRRLRGRRVAYVPQDPGTALAPNLRLLESFAELYRAHHLPYSVQRMAALIEQVGLPESEDFLRRYPHQLSGGQQQRVAIAMAFCLEPDVVVMDEPTTGLDVTTKARIAELVASMATSHQVAVAFISHDLPLLFGLAQRVVIMQAGRIVEAGPVAQIVEGAQHRYTRQLLKAWRLGGAVEPPTEVGRQVLSVRSLSAHFGSVEITSELDLHLAEGECLAVVGESGSGKTTVARSICGLHSDYQGRVLLGGEQLARDVSARAIDQRRAIQYVFQNPWGSLNPRRRVGASVAVAAQHLRGLSRRASREVAEQLLLDLGLRADHAEAMPQQLSGGQRQRVALARALAADPRVLVCDEVTSSLDASVQADIVALLKRIQAERRLSMLFITHDLALAAAIAHRVLVLKNGRVVESGPVADVLGAPQADYTQELVEAARLKW